MSTAGTPDKPTPDDRHPFRMNVLDGLGRKRPIEILARGRQVVISSPTSDWAIKLTPDDGDTLSAVVQGASDRARKQAEKP